MFARVVCAAILFAELVDAANFTVGYLTADRTETFVHKKQGRIISGAMTLAIKRINADPQLLRGHRLHFVWADTRADTLTSTNELTKQWRDGAIAFFGPEDSCDVEARVAAAWNLPMLSYVSVLRDASSRLLCRYVSCETPAPVCSVGKYPARRQLQAAL